MKFPPGRRGKFLSAMVFFITVLLEKDLREVDRTEVLFLWGTMKEGREIG